MIGTAVISEYPEVKAGDKLYAIVTPGTFSTFTRVYRPKPYFVLEVTTGEIKDDKGRDRRAYIDAPFYFLSGRACTDLDEAKKRLVKIFEEQTDGNLEINKVRLVSADEYTAGQKLEDAEQFPKMKSA